MTTSEAAPPAAFEITPIQEGFAGLVSDLDVAAVPGTDIAEAVRAAHWRYPVLAFEDQTLDAESFLAFGRLFGDFEIDEHVGQFADPEHRALIYLTNVDKDGDPDPQSADRGSAWHADSSYKANPCAHTVLYALEIPSKGGGTFFADMYRAYKTLPDDIKTALDGRMARHLFGSGPTAQGFIPLTEAQRQAMPQVEQPAVRVHPETGRKALYLNPLHTVELIGMARPDSDALLERVYAHALQPEFVYLHEWKVGQLVIWDQRCTLHRAEANFSMAERRRLMRAKITALAA